MADILKLYKAEEVLKQAERGSNGRGEILLEGMSPGNYEKGTYQLAWKYESGEESDKVDVPAFVVTAPTTTTTTTKPTTTTTTTVAPTTTTTTTEKPTTTTTTTEKQIPVTGVKLDKSTLSLEEGATATLKATVEPSNASYKAVKFTSSDEAIATVDDKGLVTAVKEGKADITVESLMDGSKTAKCELTVTAKPTTTTTTTAPTTTTTTTQATTTTTTTKTPVEE